MLFNSLQFVVFFPVVTLLYFVLPPRLRCGLLLAASCYFYMVFRPIYIFILVFTIGVDYAAGVSLEVLPERYRKWALAGSLGANLGVLAAFKYYDFLNRTFQDLLGLTATPLPLLDLILPIGLSFHVFQSLSYTIEVYRRRFPAERNFLILAVYVLFYPQLVAGPIERPYNLLRQFRETHQFAYEDIVTGLRLMLWGCFKKVVIADRLAPLVNQVYDHPQEYGGPSLTLATVLFAFQIYCDFSGYSDIAIGAARCMGFRLMKNFDSPYFSRSVSEFWRRWHISLSSWFRDYVYITLGGNRVGSRVRWMSNLFITFLLSGLWHGANWTYVIWGALNGAYVAAEIALGMGKSQPRKAGLQAGASAAAHVSLTFGLTCFAWIFFRSRTVSDSIYVAGHLFRDWGGFLHGITTRSYIKTQLLFGQSWSEVLIAVCAIVGLIAIQASYGTEGFPSFLARQALWKRWAAYYSGVIAILFFGAFNQSQQFIYFQF